MRIIQCDKCKNRVFELSGIDGKFIGFLLCLSILGIGFVGILGFIKLWEILSLL